MKTEITNAQAKKCLAEGGVFCPKCESDNINRLPFEYEEGDVYQPMHCLQCRFNWTDCYQLAAMFTVNGLFERE